MPETRPRTLSDSAVHFLPSILTVSILFVPAVILTYVMWSVVAFYPLIIAAATLVVYSALKMFFAERRSLALEAARLVRVEALQLAGRRMIREALGPLVDREAWAPGAARLEAAIESMAARYDVVVLSIGSAPGSLLEPSSEYQHLPNYALNMAQQGKRVGVFLVDPAFQNRLRRLDTYYTDPNRSSNRLQRQPSSDGSVQYTHCQIPNFTIEVFATAFEIPAPGFTLQFAERFKQTLRTFLDGSGRFYIANHTQAYDLSWVLGMADVYNAVKSTAGNATALQLYSGGGTMTTYYLDRLYDDHSCGIFYDALQIGRITRAYQATGSVREPEGDYGHYYVTHGGFTVLEQLPEFSISAAAASVRPVLLSASSDQVARMPTVLDSAQPLTLQPVLQVAAL